MGWLLRVSLPPGPDGEPVPPVDPVTTRLWGSGTTGVAELAGADGWAELLAGFDDEPAARAARRSLIDGFGLHHGGVAVEAVDDSAWTGAVPTAVVSLGGRSVEIEVGPAFGHGGHPTTALALDLVTGLTEPGATVLDAGTGTGILALAALAAGADTVVAVDDDPAALGVAAANLSPGGTLGALLGPSSGSTVVLAADLAQVTVAADLVVANVLAPVHGELAHHLRRCLAAGGRLVLSGLLADQVPAVLAHHPGLPLAEERRAGDWSALVLVVPDEPVTVAGSSAGTPGVRGGAS